MQDANEKSEFFFFSTWIKRTADAYIEWANGAYQILFTELA